MKNLKLIAQPSLRARIPANYEDPINAAHIQQLKQMQTDTASVLVALKYLMIALVGGALFNTPLQFTCLVLLLPCVVYTLYFRHRHQKLAAYLSWLWVALRLINTTEKDYIHPSRLLMDE